MTYLSDFPRTHIEINEAAVKSNLKFLKNSVAKNRTLSCVVKGNAYGHGFSTYIPLLYKHGVRHFSVYSALEAYEVSRHVNLKECTILIMGDLPLEALEWAIVNDIEFFVFDQHRLKNALDFSKRVGRPARIHIELETGMFRTGIGEGEVNKVINFIHEHSIHFHLVGLCSHLAGSESIANFTRVRSQIKEFKKLESLFDRQFQGVIKHLACSAASIRFPRTRLDLVRIGILQYGFWPSEETFVEYAMKKNQGKDQDPLKRVLTWKSYVMSKKTVPKGKFIGYGNHFLTNKNVNIAIVPVGYETGFSRSLSNQGQVLIRGKRCPVLGIVNMNCVTVDISDISEVHENDEVILIGSQKNQEISVASFGDLSSQLNYELLTRLPEDLPRRIKA